MNALKVQFIVIIAVFELAFAKEKMPNTNDVSVMESGAMMKKQFMSGVSTKWNLIINPFDNERYYATQCVIGKGPGCISFYLDICGIHIETRHPSFQPNSGWDVSIDIVTNADTTLSFSDEAELSQLDNKYRVTDIRSKFIQESGKNLEYKFHLNEQQQLEIYSILSNQDSLKNAYCSMCKAHYYRCKDSWRGSIKFLP